MWDEIKGYLVLFAAIPLGFGFLYYGIVRVTTGEWPDRPWAECSTDWDGRANPSVCD